MLQGRFISCAPERKPNLAANFTDRVLLAPRQKGVLPGYPDTLRVKFLAAVSAPQHSELSVVSCAPSAVLLLVTCAECAARAGPLSVGLTGQPFRAESMPTAVPPLVSRVQGMRCGTRTCGLRAR